MPARPPMARRAAFGVLALGTLTACGIHLEEDAPRVPLVPARKPIEGEDALVGLLLGTRALAAGVSLLPKVAAFGAALDEQARVLDSALRERGVPADKLDGPAAPGSSGSPTSSGPATGAAGATETASASAGDSATTEAGSATVETTNTGALTTGTGSASSDTSSTAGHASGTSDAAALARTSVTDARDLLSVADVALRPALASLAASRTVLAGRMDMTWQAPAAAPAALDAPVALAVLAATRAAVYGVEVAAARSTDATRERGVSTLHTLRGLVMAQEALLGAQAPPTPTAYVLPLTVTDNASAKRLVGHLLEALTRAYAAQLPTVASAPPALLTLTDWLADAAQLQSRWGADLAAFPGMT